MQFWWLYRCCVLFCGFYDFVLAQNLHCGLRVTTSPQFGLSARCVVLSCTRWRLCAKIFCHRFYGGTYEHNKFKRWWKQHKIMSSLVRTQMIRHFLRRLYHDRFVVGSGQFASDEDDSRWCMLVLQRWRSLCGQQRLFLIIRCGNILWRRRIICGRYGACRSLRVQLMQVILPMSWFVWLPLSIRQNIMLQHSLTKLDLLRSVTMVVVYNCAYTCSVQTHMLHMHRLIILVLLRQ